MRYERPDSLHDQAHREATHDYDPFPEPPPDRDEYEPPARPRRPEDLPNVPDDDWA